MLPVFLHIGRLSLYSFGAMVAIAFLVADLIARSEWQRRGLLTERLAWAPAAALAAGLLGAKLYFLAQHPPASMREAFSFDTLSGGLTWYGGLIGGVIAVALIIIWSKQPFARAADGAAPALAVAYGIGRIGCLLAGDGDYGPPSHLPWAMAFPHGTVPTIVRVHPTPLYETLAMGVIFLVLWGLRDRFRPGRLFGLYLILSGLERFLAEFVRLNPKVAGPFSEPQLWSIAVIAAGAIVMLLPSKTPVKSERLHPVRR